LALSPPTKRSTSAIKAAGGEPGSGAAFFAPAMWPATYSERLRESIRVALPSVNMRRTSSVLTSAVFWFGSASVA